MKFYSKDQLAEKFGVCRRTVDSYLQKGELSYIKLGRRVLISENDIVDFIERNKQQAYAHLGTRKLETLYQKMS